MCEADGASFDELQREIQRKMGICILHLQQYERLAKYLAAHHKLSGISSELAVNQAKRISEFSRKTLGPVVDELKDSLLTSASSPVKQSEQDSGTHHTSEDDQAGFHFSQNYSKDRYDQISRDLTEFVEIRNDLVHHFIERFDLLSEEGCSNARAYLDKCNSLIQARHFQLVEWFKSMERGRAMMASFLTSPVAQNLIVHGILPDGQGVDWPRSTIVELLRDAEQNCALNGWTSLEVAKERIKVSNPDQTPEKYGCRSWQQVVHDSRLFKLELKSNTDKPGKSRWYKSKN